MHGERILRQFLGKTNKHNDKFTLFEENHAANNKSTVFFHACRKLSEISILSPFIKLKLKYFQRCRIRCRLLFNAVDSNLANF